MSGRIAATLGVAFLLGLPVGAHAEVQLTIRDGKVSLVASDATLREILAEWSRVGSTRIINADRVSGGPLTLQLEEMPESQALGVLLRSVNGYVAAPRAVAGSGASRFDRIMIMPGTPRPRVASMAPAPFAPPPPVPVEQPLLRPAPDDTTPDQDGDRPVRTVPAPAARGTAFGVFPRPHAEPAVNAPAPQRRPSATSPVQQTFPASVTPASGAPASATPAGVSVPGMIVPAPAPSADQDADRTR